MKKVFEDSFPKEIVGDINIISNVTLLGREVKDVDLVIFGKIGHRFKRKLKFKLRNEDEYTYKNVYFSNFCLTIELKK